MNTCMQRLCPNLVHMYSSGSLGVSSRPLGSLSYTPHTLCVCVCVYTHIHPHTMTLIVKNKENTDNTFIFLNVKKYFPRQQHVFCTDYLNPVLSSPLLMNKLRIHERTCTPCGECFRNL